jgi:hypothetical protein
VPTFLLHILIGKFMMRLSSNARAQNIQGGRLLKFKGKIVSAAPAALLTSVSAVALTLTSVHADEISTVLTTPQTFATDVDHSIIATGAINITDSSTAALTIDTDYSSTFTNDGTISLTGSASDVTGLYLDGDLLAGGEIINNGTISIDVEYDTPDDVYGVFIDGDIAGTLRNTGTIDAYALGTDETASVWGIYVSDEVSAAGQILNSGTITVKAEQTDGSNAEATGIEVENDLHGLISNTGTISVTATATSYSATANGILVDANMSATGSILNSGTITVTARNIEDTSDAQGYGIQVDGTLAGLIDNTGTITVRGISDAYEAEAYGIFVDNDIEATGRILNSGTISATASGEIDGDTGTAYGILIGGAVAGLINNTGTIDVLADAGSDSGAYGYGIYVDEELSGSVLNSGSITVVAESGTDTASAYGIDIYGDVAAGATVANSGTITVTAKGGTEDYVYGTGIYLEDNVAGTVTNSGTITALAVSDTASTATASGYYIYGDVSGTVTNSGTITATATAGEDDATARGYYVGGDTSGTFTNSGMITATATVTGGTETAESYGVKLDDMTGTFTNSGTITATATNAGTGDANAYGLYVDDMDGEITDLGTITVSAANDAYAVYLDRGTGTMHVNTNDSITGLMRVEGHTVELLASGASNVFYFEDDNTGVGAFNTSVTDQTTAWFVDDDGGSMPIYAAVSTSDLNVGGNAIAVFGSQLDVFSDQFGAGVSSNAKAMSFLQGPAMGSLRPFASVGAQRFNYDATATTQDLGLSVGNVTFGLAGTMESGLDLAFGLGLLSAAGESGITDYDVSGYYLGGSVGSTFGGFDVDVGLGFGMLSTDKSRAFSATDIATASFDSNFVTAHLGAQRSFQMGSGVNLTGFGQVRYTRQNDDGYAETGSAAAATVGARTVEVTESTLGVEASKELNNGGVLSGSLTAMSRQFSGDATTAVTMFGQTANILDANANFEGVSVGIGYEQQVMDGAVLNLSLDHDLGSDGSGPNLAAGLTWSF